MGGAAAADTTDIVHYNVAIVPDLSNRVLRDLYPKPLSDRDIVKSVVENLYPRIMMHKRSENQEDKVSVAFINKSAISDFNIRTSWLTIDLSRFDSQLKRIDYIKGRAERTFQQDTTNFLAEFGRVVRVAESRPVGADIWSFFKNGVDDLLIESKERVVSYNKGLYRNKFRNVLVLLTDGYVEAGIYREGGCADQSNQCYYLSKRRIDDFRNAFRASGESSMRSFFHKHNYGIIKVDNPNLADVEVLALEFYDRSLTPSGTPTIYPTDWDVLKLFWEDWLEKSGVKRYELRPIATSREEAEEAILRFLGVD